MAQHEQVCSNHVWIVNHYAAIPSKDHRSARHLNLAMELPKHGWTASLIVASTKHPSGRQALHGRRLRFLTTENGVKTLWIRTNRYGGTALRFLGMMLFALNLLRPGVTRGLQRPSVVLGSTVHPFAAWAGWRLSRRHGVPFVYEIRDVWPETLTDLGRIRTTHPIYRLIGRLDALLISHASVVISPLPYVDRHLAEQGFDDKPFVWLPNGYVSSDRPAAAARAAGPFTFMYLGSHGSANALNGILDAFEEACDTAPELDLRLRFVGDGPLKPSLASYARSLGAGDRVRFEDAVPMDEVIPRAQEADCLVVNLLNKPVYRFGVSLNKFFMYLAAARPVIVGSSAPNNPVSDACAGFSVAGDDRSALAKAMVAMARTPPEVREQMGTDGRAAVLQQYCFEMLGKQLAEILGTISPNAVAP